MASYRQQVRIYLKEWKWVGGRQCTSSIAPSKRLENRSRVEQARGEERHKPSLWFPHSWRTVLQANLLCQGQGSEQTLSTTQAICFPFGRPSYPALHWPWKPLPSGSWGEPQEDNMQSLKLAFGLAVKSRSDPHEMLITQDPLHGINICELTARGPTSLPMDTVGHKEKSQWEAASVPTWREWLTLKKPRALV